MKKNIITLFTVLVAAVSLSVFNGTNASNETISTASVTPKNSNTVEVIYFHGKQRCATCMAIEKETKALINGELAEMVKSGKVKMRVVDISTEKGKVLAKKYKVTFSSLFIVINPGKTEKVEDITRFAFENARNNAASFREGLKEKVLAGIEQQR